MELKYYFLIISAILLAGACMSKISTFLKVPVLLVFLAVGMLAGSDGPGGISFDNGTLANIIGTIAMAYILFSGGFDTKWKSVKSVLAYGSILSSLGVFLTALFVGLFVHFTMRVPLEWGLLLGAIVSSTDAAAVFAILRSRGVSLKGKLQNMLEYESGSNDPMAAFLTIFMIGILKGGDASYWMILPQFFIKMGIGVLFGYIIGRATVWLINRIDFEYDGLYYVIGIGMVILVFGGGESLEGNGFMAVYVAGMVMGNHRYVYGKSLKRFHDGISWLMQVVLFTTLGLLVFPKEMLAISGYALLVATFMMFVARPLVCYICMVGSEFTFKERTFISWVGLRGGAPIMLATFPMMAQVDDYHKMFNIVFFIVITSVLLQGLTLMPFAKLLHLDRPLKSRPRIPLEFEYTGMSDDEMHEYVISDSSDLVGKTVAQLGLPVGALIVLMVRNNQIVVPQGSTKLHAFDALMVIGSPDVMVATGAKLADSILEEES